MIYGLSSPYLAGAMESYRTGNYGADLEDEDPGIKVCRHCGKVIRRGNTYFEVNEEVYCEDCQDMADDAILEIHRNDYMFEME